MPLFNVYSNEIFRDDDYILEATDLDEAKYFGSIIMKCDVSYVNAQAMDIITSTDKLIISYDSLSCEMIETIIPLN